MQELLKQLEELAVRIDRQTVAMIERFGPVEVYGAQNRDGSFVMTELLSAKAKVLVAIVDIKRHNSTIVVNEQRPARRIW